eukprot:TRINITY_DN5850_c0_g1_i1.p1 TRINITY_DN5850_c0_g1~~TRINITY_DN5850_c0_g1_i1.p1  ORF type:complete len:439 (+),score=80.30 TRINITY_DN5850_c0_g1_i1:159-1475(+)
MERLNRLPSVQGPMTRNPQTRTGIQDFLVRDISPIATRRVKSASGQRRGKTKLQQHLDQVRKEQYAPFEKTPMTARDRVRVAQALLTQFAINFPSYQSYLDCIQSEIDTAVEDLQDELKQLKPLRRELQLLQRRQVREIGQFKTSFEADAEILHTSVSDAHATIRQQNVEIDTLKAQVSRLEQELQTETSRGRDEKAARVLMAERFASGVSPTVAEDESTTQQLQRQMEGLQLKNTQLEDQLAQVVKDYQAEVSSRITARAAQAAVDELQFKLTQTQDGWQQDRFKLSQARKKLAEMERQRSNHVDLIAKLRTACAKAEQNLRACRQKLESDEQEAAMNPPTVDHEIMGKLFGARWLEDPLQLQEWTKGQLVEFLQELEQTHGHSIGASLTQAFDRLCAKLAAVVDQPEQHFKASVLWACHRYTNELEQARVLMEALS